jgi:enoyl-CoA hydratase/carnithine racemase
MQTIHVSGGIEEDQLNEWTGLLLANDEPLLVYIHKAYGGKRSDDSDIQLNKTIILPLKNFIQALHNTKRFLITISSGYVLGGSMSWVLASDIHYSLSNTRFGFPEIKVNELPLLVSTLISGMPLRKIRYFLVSGDTIQMKDALDLRIVHREFKDESSMKEELDYLLEIIKPKVKYLKKLPLRTIEEAIDIYKETHDVS